MSTRMPALFIGHGSPMNVLMDNEFTRTWRSLGEKWPSPRAILCVSAHWETRGVYVTATETPETIHDFYGFPKALFDIRYQAPGSPDLARRVVQLLAPQRVHLDAGRGLDHGAWGVLKPMYATADVPVIQLSIDSSQSGIWHYDLARRLRPLRNEGVLIVGSGNIVHNLPLWDWRATAPTEWGQRFTSNIKALLAAGDYQGVCQWDSLGPDATLSVPTPEHFLPLIYAIAQQEDDDDVQFVADKVVGTMGMTCVLLTPNSP